MGAGLSVLGAVVLATSAGLRRSGRADARHPEAQWAQRDDTWSRRMAAFGVVTGVGAAVAAGLVAWTPWTVCRGDQCDGGGGGVSALYVGAPIAAVGLAGLGITASHRRAHRRAVELSVGLTGVSGRF